MQKNAPKYKFSNKSQDKPHPGRKGRSCRNHKVHHESETGTVSEEELTVKTVTDVHKIGEKPQADIKIDRIKKKLRAQLDTGSETNILPKRCLEWCTLEQMTMNTPAQVHFPYCAHTMAVSSITLVPYH